MRWKDLGKRWRPEVFSQQFQRLVVRGGQPSRGAVRVARVSAPVSAAAGASVDQVAARTQSVRRSLPLPSSFRSP